MARLAIQLVTWNGARYIPYLFASLRQQSYRDAVLRVLDNGSADATTECLAKELQQVPWPVEFVRTSVNVGFAGGHNQLFQQVSEEYVLLVNQDMYLTPECLEKMVQTLDTHPEYAAVSPRLMRWEFGRIPREGLEKSLSIQIDSLGLARLRNRRFIEIDAGKEWHDTHEERREVFGVSGALPLYRVSAARAVSPDGNLFDPRFESYKEDIDLSWRLEKKGYKAAVILNAVAYHDRTVAMPKGGVSDWAAWRNKGTQSKQVRFLSYRNHLRLLFKHETRKTFLPDALAIVWYEFKKSVALFFTQPRLVVRAWKDILR